MKKLFILLLLPCLVFGATRTWNSSSSTDMNDGANYNPTGAIAADDDLVFNNTSVVNAGLATWGYVEARQHKEVRVYINVTAVLFTLRAIRCFARAAR